MGQVGEFDEDSLSWIFESDPGWRVELCGLKAVGGPESMTFRVNGTRTVIDLTDHGVPLAMKNKAAVKLKFWWLVRSDEEFAPAQGHAQLHGHFDHPDVNSWMTQIEQEAAVEAQRKQDEALLRRKRDSEKESRDHFVNPYTFVPFPARKHSALMIRA